MDPNNDGHLTESKFMQRLRKISNRASARRPSFGSPSTPSNAKPPSPLAQRPFPVPSKNDVKIKHNLAILVHNTTALASLSSPQVSEVVVNRSDRGLTPTGSGITLRQPDIEDVGLSWGAWVGLKSTLGAVHTIAEVFPPLKLAVGTLISCFEGVEKATENRQQFVELASHLKALASILDKHLQNTNSTEMEQCIYMFASSIEREMKAMSDKSRQNKTQASLSAYIDERALAKTCTRLDSIFRRLQLNVGLYTWSVTKDTFVTMILEDMRPAKLAHYNSSLRAEIHRRACTENTRTGIRSQLDQWSRGQVLSSSKVFWIWGMPGTGKSTIAYTLARDLEQRNKLAATFFCSRSSSECQDVSQILPTIAYQLAQRSRLYRAALCGILHEDRHSSTQVIHTQYDRLLKEPLQKIRSEFPEELVIVIDALDELKDKAGSGLRWLLDVICQTSVDLPLKFLITSRPEASIQCALSALANPSIHTVQLHETEKSLIQADIKLYLEEELCHICPTSNEVNQLAWQSGELFVYAATLVRYIRPQEQGLGPRSRLISALEMGHNPSMRPAEMNTLYTTLLEGILDKSNHPQEVSDRKLVLWTVLRAMEPLDLETLDRLVGFNDSTRTTLALQALGSVLHVPEDNGVISPLHASLRDFMRWHKGDSDLLSFDSSQHHYLLTRHCFDIMRQTLRFNICSLQSSYILDKDVEGLSDRITTAISPALVYASRFWGDHMALACTRNPGPLRDLLVEFLSKRLLFWMEVLNLKSNMNVGEQALLQAFKWLKVEGSQASLNGIKLVNDCRNFVTAFASSPISQSTPHIYLSALPFCHTSSLVFEKYRWCIRSLINPSGEMIERRRMTPLATRKTAPVNISVFSADTKFIALGGSDYTIAVQSTGSGTLMHGPFRGHTGPISALAFSSNPALLASGSKDCTIHIWDLQNNGPFTCSPLLGHKSKVTSVAFDSKHHTLASGSGDGTILVWTLRSNQANTCTSYALDGHTKNVTSLCFSPDDTYLASCSKDKTIRIWLMGEETQYVELFVIRCPEVSLNSLAFSPDGTRVISGSSGGTIGIWQTRTSKSVLPSFRAHPSSILCLAFLCHPDGEYFVSGSSNGIVSVWSVKNGKMIAGPFEGHDQVKSVAFSPDGTRIISCTKDGTIRTWNAFAGTAPRRSLIDHLVFVNAVTFTPNDKRIASASSKSTVCLFDATSGALALGPFRSENPLQTRAAAFSRDCTRVAFSSGKDGDRLQVCATKDGQQIGMEFEGHTSFICSVAFSSNRKIVATGSDDSSIRLWRAKRHTFHLALLGKLPTIRNLGGPIMSLCFSPDGRQIASGCGDATIQLRHTRDGSLVNSFAPSPSERHSGPVTSLVFSPDGSQIASGSDDCTIRFRYAHNGQHTVGPLRGHKGSINSIAFSSDGRYLVSGSNDRDIRIWDACTGNLVGRPFVGHTAPIKSVAFSHNGKWIVSGSDDSTIRVWDTSYMRPDNPITNIDSPTSPGQEADPADGIGGTYSDSWTVDDDGWVKDSESRLIFWVPSDIAPVTPSRWNKCVIGPHGSIQAEFSRDFDGNSWDKCYTPDPTKVSKRSITTILTNRGRLEEQTGGTLVGGQTNHALQTSYFPAISHWLAALGYIAGCAPSPRRR